MNNAFRDLKSDRKVIIVTNQDHEANSGPWRRLIKQGVEVREWSVDPDTGHLDIDNLKNLLDDKVKLVCFPHCSNIVGEINPVKEISILAKENNCKILNGLRSKIVKLNLSQTSFEVYCINTPSQILL